MNFRKIKNKFLAIFLASLNTLTISGAEVFAQVQQSSIETSQTKQVPSSLHGFTLKKLISVGEQDSKDGGNRNVLEFQHEKTGMWAIIEPNNNENKSFEVLVRTPPENDKGINHIIEHSVLNGSDEYPCKNMVWELNHISYHTFLNALTYPCYTAFPVASADEDELFSLAKIYTSGIFHPAFLKDERIFKKEGRRFELDANGKLVANGTVFNEMQNSDVDALKTVLKTVFPDTQGKNLSGGIPENILDLSYEEVCETYKKYYHPANMIVYMSGNIDYGRFMKFLDEEYLKDYNKISLKNIKYESQNPSNLPESNTAYYYKQETNKNIFSSDAIGILDYAFYLEHMSDFNILSKILNNQNSQRTKFLKDKGYLDIESSIFDIFYDPIISICLSSEKEELVSPENTKNILKEMLEKYPIDKSEIDSVLGSKSFSKKLENETNLYDSSLGSEHFIKSFIRFGDPCSEEYLEKINTNKQNSERIPSAEEINNLAKTSILESKNTTLILKPSSDEKISSKERLRSKINSLESQKDILTKGYEEQKAWSEAPNAEEDLNKLKKMFKKLSDINTPQINYPLESKQIKENISYIKKIIQKFSNSNKCKSVEDVKCYHSSQEVGDIISYKLVFNVNNLNTEELQHLQLLTNALNSNNTTKHSRQELNKLKADRCQISSTMDIFNSGKNNSKNVFLIVNLVMDKNKADESIDLMKEQLLDVDFKDKDTLEKHVKLTNITNDSTPKAQAEFYHILAKDLLPLYNYLYKDNKSDYDKKFYEEIKSKLSEDGFINSLAEKLTNLRDKIFNINSLQGVGTCSSKENETLTYDKLKTILNFLNTKNQEQVAEVKLFQNNNKNVGYVDPSASNNNITCVIDSKELCSSVEFDVTCRIINDKFLAPEIREKNGAYGASISRLPKTNKIVISSNHDPNMESTINTFKAIPEFIKNLDITDAEIEDISKSVLGLSFPTNKLSVFSSQTILKICSGVDYCNKVNSDIENIKKMTKEKMKQHGLLLEKAIPTMRIYAVSNNRKNFDEKVFTQILE